jgi:uncharacterized membrane protein YdbT with pleckstrin-like domain
MKTSVDSKTDQQLHRRLPIGPEEQILGVYKHHWFVYASIWALGLIVAVAIMTVATLFASTIGVDGSTGISQQTVIVIGAALFSGLILLATWIPAWLRSQEQLVVTDEALLQILQPSIFGSKVSQLSLQHVADVSVRKDLFGTLFGFGNIMIETPGEQSNYSFAAIGPADDAARTIIDAHENFTAALESGRMPTTIKRPGNDSHSVEVDAAEYQKFLDYQQYQARMRDEQAVESKRQT